MFLCVKWITLLCRGRVLPSSLLPTTLTHSSKNLLHLSLSVSCSCQSSSQKPTVASDRLECPIKILDKVLHPLVLYYQTTVLCLNSVTPRVTSSHGHKTLSHSKLKAWHLPVLPLKNEEREKKGISESGLLDISSDSFIKSFLGGFGRVFVCFVLYF